MRPRQIQLGSLRQQSDTYKRGFTEEIQSQADNVAAVSHTQEEVHQGDPESRKHSSSSQAQVHPADTVAAVRNAQATGSQTTSRARQTL